MDKIIAISIICIAAIIGIFVMRRVDPQNKIYPIYAALVTVAFSTVVWFC